MTDEFLNSQIITYLGNKRALLGEIEKVLFDIQKKLGKEKMVCVDLFSGSGVVARLMKNHASLVIANDLEMYSEVINNCYLSNVSEFDEKKYKKYFKMLSEKLKEPISNGIIASNYAPKNDRKIVEGERVFYTTENAIIIDTLREGINDIEPKFQKYFLAPLLYEASVHNNTAGVFKGFYKDKKTGVGKYGGDAENALKRIKGKIELAKPILSEHQCDYEVYREDANILSKTLKNLDVAYIDPPYNQHPYGSNYFMLNIIVKQSIDVRVSKVSGIPKDWNRSKYNKKQEVVKEMASLIENIDSKYIIVSYNSEGFIDYEQMKDILSEYGEVYIKEIQYNAYRASRNLSNRERYVKEFLFILRKRK